MDIQFPTCHCATCADEALPAEVVSIDQEGGLALVLLAGEQVEVDISLVDDVAEGGWLLVHGGVAMSTIAAEDLYTPTMHQLPDL